MKKHILKVVSLSILFVAVFGSNQNDWLDYVVSEMRSEQNVKYTTLMLSAPPKMSSTSALIVRKLNEEFLSYTVHPVSLQSESINPNVNHLDEMLVLNSNRAAINVMLVDASIDNKTISTAVLDNFSHFKNLWIQDSRPFFLIFCINVNIALNFKELLETLWLDKYLYVSIIEVIYHDNYKNLLKVSTVTAHENIFIHQYNPFNDSYEVTFLSSTVHLFNEKLKNLHGYTLNAGLFVHEFSMMSAASFRGNLLNSLSGTDFWIAETVAYALNYTMNITFFNNSTSMILVSDINPIFDHGIIDFCLNWWGIEDNRNTTNIYIVRPYDSLHLLVKQYGYYETAIPSSLLSTIFAVGVIFVLISASIYLSGFKSEFITKYNIVLLLLGIPITIEPNNIKERILSMYLLIISSIFSMQALCYLFEQSFNKQKFYVFHTLEDVADSGIKIKIDYEMNKTLSLYEAFELASSEVSVIPAENKTCIHMMIRDDTVNVCKNIQYLANFIARHNKSAKNGWIVSVIKEPIKIYWPSLLLSKFAPYKNAFDRVIKITLESGLYLFWLSQSLSIYGRKIGVEEISYKIIQPVHNEMDLYQSIEERQPGIKLIYSLVLGYLISFLIFIIELILRKR